MINSGCDMDVLKYTIVLLAAVLFSGCASEPVSSPGPVSLAGANKVRAMAVAEDVLLDMHFAIEKADAEKGYLVTKPLRGGQVLEFWRSDNASAVAALESSFQSLQRTAEVVITDDGSGVKVACNVEVRRLSLPENDYVTQSRAAGMFTSSSSALQRLEVREEQAEQMEWIDLGPDAALGKKILGLIEARISRVEG